MTLTEYIQSYRIKQAAKLICTTSDPIANPGQHKQRNKWFKINKFILQHLLLITENRL